MALLLIIKGYGINMIWRLYRHNTVSGTQVRIGEFTDIMEADKVAIEWLKSGKLTTFEKIHLEGEY
jgi:hypothetical protein